MQPPVASLRYFVALPTTQSSKGDCLDTTFHTVTTASHTPRPKMCVWSVNIALPLQRQQDRTFKSKDFKKKMMIALMMVAATSTASVAQTSNKQVETAAKEVANVVGEPFRVYMIR